MWRKVATEGKQNHFRMLFGALLHCTTVTVVQAFETRTELNNFACRNNSFFIFFGWAPERDESLCRLLFLGHMARAWSHQAEHRLSAHWWVRSYWVCTFGGRLASDLSRTELLLAITKLLWLTGTTADRQCALWPNADLLHLVAAAKFMGHSRPLQPLSKVIKFEVEQGAAVKWVRLLLLSAQN